MTTRTWVAEPHEAETVAALLIAFRDHLDSDWPSDNAFLAGVERLLDDPHTEFLLGAPHDDAPPAGVAQIRFRFGIWHAGIDCHLEDLFVRDEARGSGLGRALVQSTIDRARARDAKRIELDCNASNTAAQALYRSFGFSSAAKSPRYEGKDDLFLRLRLNER